MIGFVYSAAWASSRSRLLQTGTSVPTDHYVVKGFGSRDMGTGELNLGE